MRITPARLFGFLAMLIVWLNITNLYLLLSALTKVSFRNIGILFILILGAYVASNSRFVQVLLHRNPIVFFLILFVAIPIGSVVFASYIPFSLIGYLVLSALIFLSCMVWIKQEGWERFSMIVLSAWAVGVVGIILSYFMPTLFQSIAQMQEAASSGGGVSWAQLQVAQARLGRAFGFYMQSNRACLVIVMFLIILLPCYFHDKPFWRMLILGISAFANLLTGSRAGFIYITLFVAMLFLSEMMNGVRDKNKIQSGVILLPRYIFLGVFALVALFVALNVQSQSKSGESAATRIITSFFDSETSLGEDKSVNARLNIQKAFFIRALRSPIYGYGLGGSDYARMRGEIAIASHNNYAEMAHNYGFPVAIAMYGFLFYLGRTRQAKHMQGYFRYNVPMIFFVFIAVASLASHTLLDYRVFPTIMAFMLMMLYFPTSSKGPQPGSGPHPAAMRRPPMPPQPMGRIR